MLRNSITIRRGENPVVIAPTRVAAAFLGMNCERGERLDDLEALQSHSSKPHIWESGHLSPPPFASIFSLKMIKEIGNHGPFEVIFVKLLNLFCIFL